LKDQRNWEFFTSESQFHYLLFQDLKEVPVTGHTHPRIISVTRDSSLTRHYHDDTGSREEVTTLLYGPYILDRLTVGINK
jgi:hypothetical protein